MTELQRQIYHTGIVPVIAIEDATKAVPLAKALVRGGLPIAEVTFRTACAEEAMRRITAEVPEILVGAGTVLTRTQVDRALEAGAQFIVSPGLNPNITRYVLDKGAVMLPGCETPGEMEQAMEWGIDVVKFFPAEQNGGLAKIKALSSTYPNLRFMPTGGVNPQNMLEYLAFDRILACGGTWMVKKELIEAEAWDDITRICKEAVRQMLGLSLMQIELACADQAEGARIAQTLTALFDLPEASAPLPITCTPSHQRGGCITLGTHHVGRAMHHLSRRGIAFDGSSIQQDQTGKPSSVYLQADFAGFALKLMQYPKV